MRKLLPVLGVWGCLALAGVVSTVWGADRLAILIALAGLLIVVSAAPIFREIPSYLRRENTEDAGEGMDRREEAPLTVVEGTAAEFSARKPAAPALGRAKLGVSGPGAGRRQAAMLKDKSYLLRCGRGVQG